MKVKSFKSFLTEDPIPLDQEDVDALNITGKKAGDFKINFTEMRKRFTDKFGQHLAKGSSRIVFQIDVPVEMFFEYTLTDLKIAEGQTVQPTVIKLALNAKGIQQNIAEKQLWHEVQGSYWGCQEYFCPILDWAGNPDYKNDYQYSIDFDHYISQEASLGFTWIQMPLCQKVSKKQLEKILMEEFGANRLLNGNAVFDLWYFTKDNKVNNSWRHEREKINDMGLISDKQHQAYDDFIDFATQNDLDDFRQAANWGLQNGKPVLLDYGYDLNSAKLYWDKKNYTQYIHIDKDQRIVSTIRKKQLSKNYW